MLLLCTARLMLLLQCAHPLFSVCCYLHIALDISLHIMILCTDWATSLCICYCTILDSSQYKRTCCTHVSLHTAAIYTLFGHLHACADAAHEVRPLTIFRFSSNIERVFDTLNVSMHVLIQVQSLTPCCRLEHKPKGGQDSHHSERT